MPKGNPNPKKPPGWDAQKFARSDNTKEELALTAIRLPVSAIAYIGTKQNKSAWIRRVIDAAIASEKLAVAEAIAVTATAKTERSPKKSRSTNP